MSMNEQMNHAEESILHTYNRFPVMFDHGEGCYLYDTEGKKYLDFAAGIAVNALGYHYPGYDDALKSQIDKLTHISNLYYNEPMSEAGEKLIKASGLSKAFFTNSGTEAIEGALKAARKYSYTKYGKEAGRFEIIAMNHSFHGRSMGALSVTGTEHYREPFEPLIGGVKFADFNDLESVKAQITDKTCAVITEVVQGEGGIYPAQKEFLEGLRALAPKHLGAVFRLELSFLVKKQQQRLWCREIMVQLMVEILSYVQQSVRYLISLNRITFLHMCRNLHHILRKNWMHLWINARLLQRVVEKVLCRDW